jgi:hypothetical protein
LAVRLAPLMVGRKVARSVVWKVPPMAVTSAECSAVPSVLTLAARMVDEWAAWLAALSVDRRV